MRSRVTFKILLAAMLALLISLCPMAMNNIYGESDQPLHDWNMPYFRDQSFWRAMPGHFELLDANLYQPSVQHEIHWFQTQQIYIKELTHNARLYIYYVYQQSLKRHMPAEVALMPMIESNYKPFLYSNRGATGLWQLMPGTASGFGLKINWWYDGRRDILASTNAALDYLRYLHSYFGSWLLAMAAYDCGEGTVDQAIRYNKRHHRATDFWALPLPLETKTYVPKIIALAAIIKNPKYYHLHLEPLANVQYFEIIRMHRQINLDKVARISDTSIKIVRKLNPGFRRWATIPKGFYKLLLPIGNAKLFLMRMAEPGNRHVTWLHHKVANGESLGKIAKEYHTNASILKEVNNLKSDMIHIGENLLVPKFFHGKYTHEVKRQHGSIAEDKLPGPKRIVYTVANHDNLWRVAARFNVKPNQIRYWNKLGYHHHLHAGQQLVIWKHRRYVPKSYYHYPVKRGDSLSRIASRLGVNINTIKKSNRLSSNVVQIGEHLKIPILHRHKHYVPRTKNMMIVHHVRAHESLLNIARYYRVSTKELIDWNHLQRTKYLRLGQSLKIYLTR